MPSGPSVVMSEASPTGYLVTFRFDAPDADNVWLAGDVYFSTPDLISTTGAQASWLGDSWAPGHIPALPQAQDLAPMSREAGGTWVLTTAVPAGLWNYGFVTEECTMTLLCATVHDPTNPPPLPSGNEAHQSWSQLFVPTDHTHPTYDAANQLPAAAHERGTLATLRYESDMSIGPVASRPIGVYLPPGYDASRVEPYPLLVLSHGAGDDETAWWTQGGAAYQLDNAIAKGTIPPVVAITTTFNGIAEQGMGDPQFFERYATDLVDNVLPFTIAHLNASPDSTHRAFAGLSMGGLLAEHLLLTHPSTFAAYGMWSMPAGVTRNGLPVSPTQLANAATARAVHLGTGAHDSLTPSPVAFEDLASRYRAAGLQAHTLDTQGGHAWWVWRLMLSDFIATTAFAP